MGKTATDRARLEPEIKEGAEKIPQNLNEETRTALRQSEKGLEVTRFDSARALFEDLEI